MAGKAIRNGKKEPRDRKDRREPRLRPKIDTKVLVFLFDTRMEAEYQNKSCTETIRYNYIDKNNHLTVKVNLCMKSISYLKEQLLHGTTIKLSLYLVLPEWYQTELSLSTVGDFFGSCNCCSQHEPVFTTTFLSFKGQIEILLPSEKGVRNGMVLRRSYNTLFHITNTERLKLNTYLRSKLLKS
jgi:hypothetical protein